MKAYDTGARFRGSAIILESGNIWDAEQFLHWIDRTLNISPNQHVPPAQFEEITEKNRVLLLRPKTPSDHAGVLLDMLVERLATSEDFEAIKRDVQAVLDSYAESKQKFIGLRAEVEVAPGEWVLVDQL